MPLAANRFSPSDDEQFQSLIDASNDGVVVTDEQGNIAAWSAGAGAIFGYSGDEVLGRPVAMLVPPSGNRPQQSGFEGFPGFSLGISGKAGEIRCLKKDGSEFPALLALARWKTVNRWCSAGFFRDVGELKRLEEQARQSQKMEAVGNFASGIAHDFNNMLTIINGYSDVLLEDFAPTDAVREAVQCIKDAGLRAAALTQQLLGFSRRRQPSTKALDLNAVIVELRQMLRRLIGADIELTTVLDSSIGQVQADAGQVEQIVMNLVVNARDAMPQGGKINIETRNVALDSAEAEQFGEVQPGSYVLLTISDTGCGMDDTVKERIFEPFFTTKEPGKGTELGLATVFNIVKQAAGHVGVCSEPNRGTMFKVYLPRIAAADPAAAPADKTGTAQQTLLSRPVGETILLVDDDYSVRNFSARVLRQFGYRVLEAAGARDALALVEHHDGPIDLLVTDVNMPEMDGPELTGQIARIRPAIRAIYTSGFTLDHPAMQRAGLDPNAEFLQKPFTPKMLAAKVRSVLAAAQNESRPVDEEKLAPLAT